MMLRKSPAFSCWALVLVTVASSGYRSRYARPPDAAGPFLPRTIIRGYVPAPKKTSRSSWCIGFLRELVAPEKRWSSFPRGRSRRRETKKIPKRTHGLGRNHPTGSINHPWDTPPMTPESAFPRSPRRRSIIGPRNHQYQHNAAACFNNAPPRVACCMLTCGTQQGSYS